MSKEPLLSHTEVLALDGLRTNPQAVELISFAVHSVTAGLLGQEGDIDTLNVQIFPSYSEGKKVLEINVTVNKLPEDD